MSLGYCTLCVCVCVCEGLLLESFSMFSSTTREKHRSGTTLVKPIGLYRSVSSVLRLSSLSPSFLFPLCDPPPFPGPPSPLHPLLLTSPSPPYRLYLSCLAPSPLLPRLSRGGQMAERLGNRAINQRLPVRFPAMLNDVVSFGQGTSPYLPLGESPCTCCKSLWIRASAK